MCAALSRSPHTVIRSSPLLLLSSNISDGSTKVFLNLFTIVFRDSHRCCSSLRPVAAAAPFGERADRFAWHPFPPPFHALFSLGGSGW